MNADRGVSQLETKAAVPAAQRLYLVGAGGFEPPKSSTTDLQSAPFGHSGTLPYWSRQKVSHDAECCWRGVELVDGLEPPTC